MRRLVVGVAAGLLLCPLAIASSSTACAETKIRERTVSRLVARSPLWWSVGLITVEKGAGKLRVQAGVRGNPGQGDQRDLDRGSPTGDAVG